MNNSTNLQVRHHATSFGAVQAGRPLDQVDDDRLRGAASADRSDSLLPALHMLAKWHGQLGWVAALRPLSADGMIVAASTTLLANSHARGRGGYFPRALLMRQVRCSAEIAPSASHAASPPANLLRQPYMLASRNLARFRIRAHGPVS
jgi:hypothetical protein